MLVLEVIALINEDNKLVLINKQNSKVAAFSIDELLPDMINGNIIITNVTFSNKLMLITLKDKVKAVEIKDIKTNRYINSYIKLTKEKTSTKKTSTKKASVKKTKTASDRVRDKKNTEEATKKDTKQNVKQENTKKEKIIDLDISLDNIIDKEREKILNAEVNKVRTLDKTRRAKVEKELRNIKERIRLSDESIGLTKQEDSINKCIEMHLSKFISKVTLEYQLEVALKSVNKIYDVYNEIRKLNNEIHKKIVIMKNMTDIHGNCLSRLNEQEYMQVIDEAAILKIRSSLLSSLLNTLMLNRLIKYDKELKDCIEYSKYNKDITDMWIENISLCKAKSKSII